MREWLETLLNPIVQSILLMSEEYKFYKKTIIISLLIFVVVSISFFYLEGVFIKKIDERMGGKAEDISVLSIVKSYDLMQETPKIVVVYSTLKKSTSYIKIDNIRSESNYGKNFTKTLIMDKFYSGKNINVTIVAIDDNNIEKKLITSVVLPRRLDSEIRITG